MLTAAMRPLKWLGDNSSQDAAANDHAHSVKHTAVKTSAITDSKKFLESANTIIETPKPATAEKKFASDGTGGRRLAQAWSKGRPSWGPR